MDPRAIPRVILQGSVIDTVIDRFPGETARPAAHLPRPNAVLEEGSGVQHMRMPYHEDICSC